MVYTKAGGNRISAFTPFAAIGFSSAIPVPSLGLGGSGSSRL